MDRIRQALDLARAERSRGAPAAPAPQETPRSAEPRVPMHLVGGPVYTETRVFSPDPATLESNRIVASSADSPASEAFRMLRTQVLQRMQEHAWSSLAILSPGERDGKTTAAINLAISLATDHRHTVLLVDCDLRRPAIARFFGLHVEHGIDDILRGEADLSQCLVHPDSVERLVLLPAREPMADSSEVLGGPRGRALVAELRGRYPDRIVLFDLPPVLVADDALAFLPMVECALVVVAERATRRSDLLRCMELVHKTPVVGTVLNKAADMPARYG
jgi:Mrp family chromosome partitioning ATPase